MKHFIAYILLLFFSIAFFSCKKKQGLAQTKPHETGQVEPDQLNPQLDTRLQETFFAAQLEKSKGDFKKAYPLFEECLKIEPTNAAVHYELGKMDLMQNNSSGALTHAKICVEENKQNAWYQMLLGDTYMGLAKYEQAAKAYKEVSKLNADDPNILYHLATAQLYAGKKEDAIATYNELEKRTGPYEELSLQKHKLYLELKDQDKAGKELEKLANAFPEEAHYWGIVAQYYQHIDQPAKAQAAMEEMIKAGNDSGQVHYQLSEFYASQKEDEKSYSELKKAFATTDISIDQKISVLLRYLSLTEFDDKYLTQAYELLDLTLQTNPDEAKTYSIYGDFLYRDGKKKEALEKYKHAVTIDASRHLIWEQIVLIESEMENYSEMEKDTKRALELFPNMPEFYYYNGLANQRLKNNPSAIESFNIGKELVVENNDLLARFYASLGEVYHAEHLDAKSDDAYDEALRLDAKNVFVLNNYAYYLCLRKTKLEQAAQMSKLSNEIAPGTASFEDTYAWILFHQEKYADALQWIERALSHSVTNGELLEHYGDILFKSARVNDALTQWKAAAAAGGASDAIEQKIRQQKIP